MLVELGSHGRHIMLVRKVTGWRTDHPARPPLCLGSCAYEGARNGHAVTHAGALIVAGLAATIQGHLVQARVFHEPSVALWREVGDTVGLAQALAVMGQCPATPEVPLAR